MITSHFTLPLSSKHSLHPFTTHGSTLQPTYCITETKEERAQPKLQKLLSRLSYFSLLHGRLHCLMGGKSTHLHLSSSHAPLPYLISLKYLASLSRFGPPGHSKVPSKRTISGDKEGYLQFQKKDTYNSNTT